MQVLHVIPDLDPRGGGPPAALEGLATAQQRGGVDVRVLTAFRRDSDSIVAERLIDAKVPVDAVGPVRRLLGRHPDMSSQVNRAVAAADIVVIHAMWEEIQHQAARAAQRLGKPYIVRPCGMLDPWSLAQSKWRKRLFLAWRVRSNLNRAAAVHFTTEQERVLVEPLGLRASTIVEPNGIDLSQYQTLPEPGTYRRAMGIGETTPLALFMSRLHHKKGLDLLIPAFAEIAEQTAARLLIAGPDDGGYQTTVEQMINEHGMSDRIQLVGMLSGQQKLAALQDADLFTLTSYQENFGNVVIEAMGCGTPVLISDQVNLCSDVERAEVGEVVPTSVPEITVALRTWLSDRGRCAEVGQRARAFTLENFDWKAIARRWTGHYKKIIGERSGRA